jgi:hypothetical protein
MTDLPLEEYEFIAKTALGDFKCVVSKEDIEHLKIHVEAYLHTRALTCNINGSKVNVSAVWYKALGRTAVEGFTINDNTIALLYEE